LKFLFLLFSALAFSCNISIASDSLLTDHSIFGTLISEDTLTIPDLNHFQIIEPYLFTHIGAQYSDISVIQLRDPNNFKTVWSQTGPCHFYYFSTGKNKSIVVNVAGYEYVKSTKVYDINSGLLFAIENPGIYIVPSPNSNYFYTKYSPYSSSGLTLFDRSGAVILSNPWGLSSGYTFALNDSIITFIQSDTIYFVSVSSGKTITAISAPRDRIGGIFAVADKQGRQQAVKYHQTTMLIDSNLNIGWIDSSRIYVNNLSFSDDGRFLATYYSNKDGTFLSLVKSNNGKPLWTESLELNYHVGEAPQAALTFTKNFIRLLDPQADYFGEGILRKSSQTFLFKVDSLSGELLEKITIPGVTLLLADSNYIKSFSVTPHKPFKIIVKKWSETSR